MIRRKTKRAYSFRVRARACVCTAEKKDLDEFPLSSFSLSLSLCLSRTRAVTRVSFLYRYLVQEPRGERVKKRLGFNIFNLGFVFLSLPRACLCVGETARVFLTTRASIGKKKINDGEEGILRDGFER